MESRGNVVQVVSVQTGDRNTTISSHIDVVVVLEFVDLLGGETSVGEHANLAGHVAPVVSAAVVLELLDEARSHFLHAA